MTTKVKIIKEITDKYGNKIVLDEALCEKMSSDMFEAMYAGKTRIVTDNRKSHTINPDHSDSV